MNAFRLNRSCWLAASLLLGAAFLDPAAAESLTISWDADCRYTIQIDTKKHDERRVRNTIEFLYSSGTPIPGARHEAASLDTYRKECADSISRRDSVALLPLPGIERYRKIELEILRDTCAYEAAVLDGYRNPSALRGYAPAATQCARFVDALEGRTDLVSVWRETIQASCKKNPDPVKCELRYFDEAEKPDGVEHIRDVVRRQGWSNCAVAYRKTNTIATGDTSRRLKEQFERMFKPKQEQCSWEQFEDVERVKQ
jgi:hypothetical protein